MRLHAPTGAGRHLVGRIAPKNAAPDTGGKEPGVYETKGAMLGTRQFRVVGSSGRTELQLIVSDAWASAELTEYLWQLLESHRAPALGVVR